MKGRIIQKSTGIHTISGEIENRPWYWYLVKSDTGLDDDWPDSYRYFWKAFYRFEVVKIE